MNDLPSPTNKPVRALTLRALLVATVITFAVMAWVQYSELVTPTSQMSESTPPIPAILGLGFVWALFWLWHRGMEGLKKLPGLNRLAALGDRLTLTRHEILAVYLFLIVSCAMPSVGVIRLVLPCLMGLQYFGEPSNHYAEMAQYIPPAWAPKGEDAVLTFWEGTDRTIPPTGLEGLPIIGPVVDGVWQFFGATFVVPWGEWGVPFAVWSLYLTCYFISMFCLVTLFRRKWTEDERLQFPLATMSIEMVRTGESPGTGVQFFRDPVMWIGFGIAVIYNGMNMLNALNPAVPAMHLMYPIGSLFTEMPWRAMSGLAFWYKPEVMGLGYVVPSQILLSILVFSLLLWFTLPAAATFGYQKPGFPFDRTQAVGSMIVLGLYFVWQARDRLQQVLRKALYNDPSVDDTDQPLSYRAAFWGTVVSLAVLVGFPIAYGVSWWPALIYFAIGTLFVIAYAHNRAETGLPIVWGYPIEKQNLVLPSFCGSAPLLGDGRLRSFTLLSMLNFYQRGTWYAVNSTGHESCIVGHTMGLGVRRTTKLLFVAMLIGLVSAFWMYLACYNTYGGNIMETVGGTSGGQRVQIAMSVFNGVSRMVDQPVGPNRDEIAATLVGAAVTIALILIRRQFFWFPLHPVGYFFACCHMNYMWFAALVILTARAVVTRIGGARLYRRLAPAFYALTLGHFFSVGVWSFVGLFAGDQVQRYRVWFL
jgi:hypothetical protein